MHLKINPLHPGFGAEVLGVDFSRPASDMPVDELRTAIDEYGVLVFRGDRPPTDDEHVAFGRLFGPVEVGPTFKVSGETKKRITNPALVDVGNLDADGNILAEDNRRRLVRLGDRLWHTDMSFMDNRATYSLLVGHEIPPEGGDTHFCDMRSALATLPDAMRAMLSGLTVSHSIWHSRQRAGFSEPTAEELASRPPALHPMIVTHPRSGTKSLYIASHAQAIVGWPDGLARDLIDALVTFATRPDNVYAHRWRMGDVLMWDNLSTMHRATEFADTLHRRDMRRVTCRERPVDAMTAAA